MMFVNMGPVAIFIASRHVSVTKQRSNGLLQTFLVDHRFEYFLVHVDVIRSINM